MTEWYVFSSIVEPRLASNIFGRLVSLVTVCRCSMCNLNHINSTRSISNLVVFGFKCVDSGTRMASVNKPPNKKNGQGQCNRSQSPILNLIWIVHELCFILLLFFFFATTHWQSITFDLDLLSFDTLCLTAIVPRPETHWFRSISR